MNEAIKRKRVVTLYRVSTKKQLEVGNDGRIEDIPVQRKSCLEFIRSKPGWELVQEYTEAGVSGYKKSAAERDELIKIRCDAELGKFDVLLVYMLDRLGRRENETPFILQWFIQMGVEVWSVVEGQQVLNDHNDNLLNYLRFWLASGESIKTSIRVKESHAQMVKEGRYRGGTLPYGYKTVNSGRLSKRGKELLDVVIDPEEAQTVRKIFQLVDQEGYGQYRIAKLLNDTKVPTRSGKSWSSSTINGILSNPIYKGCFVMGRRAENPVISKDPIPHLVIVEEQLWDRVQKLRNNRNPENTKNTDVQRELRTTKGSLLFIGYIKCGHCGNPLTTTWNKKRYTLKDGTRKEVRSAKYRCSGKALMKANCSGQTIYSQRIIEGAVLEEVYRYLDRLEKVDLREEIEQLRKEDLHKERKEVEKLKLQLDKDRQNRTKLMEEVIRALNGQSHFTSDTLNELIEKQNEKIAASEERLKHLEEKLAGRKNELEKMETVQSTIPVWREVFESASIEKKKMMLRTIIEQITVCRDSIDVKFKIRMQRFLDMVR